MRGYATIVLVYVMIFAYANLVVGSRAIISSPYNGATLSGEVTLIATVDGTPTKVQFYRAPNELIGVDSDPSDGWSVVWNTDAPSVLNGYHTLYAVAWDGDQADYYAPGVDVKVLNDAGFSGARAEVTSPKYKEKYIWGLYTLTANVIEGNAYKVQFHIYPPGASTYQILEDLDGRDGWSVTYDFNQRGTYMIAAVACSRRGSCDGRPPYTYVWAQEPEEQEAFVDIPLNSVVFGTIQLSIKTVVGYPTTAEVFVDGVSIGNAVPVDYSHAFLGRIVRWELSWDTTSVPDGRRELTVVACYEGKYCTSNPVPVYVFVWNNQATAVITYPQHNATVSGIVKLKARTVQGEPEKVCYTVDGQLLACSTSPPDWEVSWDTTHYSNGPHTLFAMACTNLGCQRDADKNSITVFVNNAQQPQDVGNNPPVLEGISIVPSQVHANQSVTVSAVGVNDVDGNLLSFYCNSFSGASQNEHSYCAVENIPPPYELSCSFNAPEIVAKYPIYCKVFDGNLYSDEQYGEFEVISGTKLVTTINPNGTDWVKNDVSFTLTCMLGDTVCDQNYTTYYSIVAKDSQCSRSFDMEKGLRGTVSCPENTTCVSKVCFYSASSSIFEPIRESNVFLIDKQPPEIDYNVPPEVTNAPVSVQLSCTDEGVGCAGTFYKINNGSWLSGDVIELSESGRYVITVKASDVLNNEHQLSFSVQVDLLKPVPPQEIVATVKDGNVVLEWSAGYDPEPATGIKEYIVERAENGAFFTEIARIDKLTYVDSNVTYGASYNYRILAVDRAGNVSDPSKVVTVSVSMFYDNDDNGQNIGIDGDRNVHDSHLTLILQQYVNGKKPAFLFQDAVIEETATLEIEIVGDEPYLEGEAIEFRARNAEDYSYFSWDFGDGHSVEGYMLKSVKHPFYLDNTSEKVFRVTLTAATQLYLARKSAVVKVVKSPLKVKLVKPVPLPSNVQNKEQTIDAILVVQDINDKNIPFDRIYRMEVQIGDKPLSLNATNLTGNFRFSIPPSFTYFSPVDYIHVVADANLDDKLIRTETWLPVYFKPAYFEISDPLKRSTYCIGEPIGKLSFMAFKGKIGIKDAHLYVVVLDKDVNREYVAKPVSGKYVTYINIPVTRENVFDLNLIVLGVDSYGNIAYKQLSRINQPMHFTMLVPERGKFYGYSQPITFKARPNRGVVSQRLFLISSDQKKPFVFDGGNQTHTLRVRMPSYSSGLLSAEFLILADTILENGRSCKSFHKLRVPLSNQVFIEFLKPAPPSNELLSAQNIEVVLKYADGETLLDVPSVDVVVFIEGTKVHLELKRTDNNTYVGEIRQNLPPGTYLLNLKLIPPFRGETTISVSVLAEINYLLLVFGVMLLTVVLFGYKYLERRYQKYKTLQAERQREIRMFVALLDKLKEEYLARHITREQYRQRAAEIMARLESFKETRRSYRNSLFCFVAVGRVLGVWRDFLLLHVIYLRVLTFRALRKFYRKVIFKALVCMFLLIITIRCRLCR